MFAKTLVILVYFECKLTFCLFGVLWTIITIWNYVVCKNLCYFGVFWMLRSVNMYCLRSLNRY